ncbi:hypothetical protein [Phenylobacterium sp. J367]|uniref:hypothetical protein n=1 Tax=Phenylobacterium sp. J367 TaxID=2898435 RepID=UPI0021510CDD|nr:hypothetical protein [Phenylobacterium sp. J367]MCR5880527.1 hypothetical protein [Phenylobacterium sp. J367]
MSEDRSLFGDGRYPEAGPLAVMARLSLLGAGLAIIVAKFLPSELVPDFVRSPNLQHFAAFYVLTLCALAAMPRTRLRTVAAGVGAFATVLEALHLLSGAALAPLMDNWVADLGGLAAATAPIVVERFRRRFPRATGA